MSRSIGMFGSLLVSLLVVAGGCHASAEKRADDLAKANAVKVEKKQAAQRDVERGDNPLAAREMVESQEADEKAESAEHDFLDALAREHRRYAAMLTKELAWVDRRTDAMEKDAASAQGAARDAKEQDVTTAHAWRDRLRRDLDDVQAAESTDAGEGWTALKKRIERDLYDDRPASIPRTYEKAYGI